MIVEPDWLIDSLINWITVLPILERVLTFVSVIYVTKEGKCTIPAAVKEAAASTRSLITLVLSGYSTSVDNKFVADVGVSDDSGQLLYASVKHQLGWFISSHEKSPFS